jgi:hypothetical protein
MLSLQKYAELFPNEKAYGSWASHVQLGAHLISEGYLQFTPDTACCWGGPWEGGYARFVLTDFTEAIVTHGPDKGLSYLDSMDKRRYDNYEKAVRHAKFMGKDIPEWSDEPKGEERGYASKQFPVRLWVVGNDDTSYSKTYRTVQEALDELALFTDNEPLDFHDFRDCGFIFTN